MQSCLHDHEIFTIALPVAHETTVIRSFYTPKITGTKCSKERGIHSTGIPFIKFICI